MYVDFLFSAMLLQVVLSKKMSNQRNKVYGLALKVLKRRI